MSKQYKRKLYYECDSADKDRRQDIRKSLNSSERQRGKAVAVSGMEDYLDTKDEKFIRDLRWELEDKHAWDCYRLEQADAGTRFAKTLERFGLPRVKLYKCTCPNLDKLTDEEILKLGGHA